MSKDIALAKKLQTIYKYLYLLDVIVSEFLTWGLDTLIYYLCTSIIVKLCSLGCKQIWAVMKANTIGMPTILLMKMLGLTIHKIDITDTDNNKGCLFLDFRVAQI